MTFKDLFSGDAGNYSRYRPAYPQALFAALASLSPCRQRAWDCATGSGQAATALATYFNEVIATDASRSQIKQAQPHRQIDYRVAPAEQSAISPASVDLITVAQALHWFDISAFFGEAHRVLRDGGVLAVWCYQLLTVFPAVDALLASFYAERLGAYWPPERQLVERGYADLCFPFDEARLPSFEMAVQWDLPQLMGYLGTWSAVRCCQQQQGINPLEELYPQLLQLWLDPHRCRRIRWPLCLRVRKKPQ
jgi:SAM-dependent methyltransferase